MYVRLLYIFICVRLPASSIIKQVKTMATARLDMRIDVEDKANAEKAAALLGKKNLTEYVTQLIRQNAEEVIREHETITVKNTVFDRFIAACDAVAAPNKKLRAAATRTKKRGFK